MGQFPPIDRALAHTAKLREEGVDLSKMDFAELNACWSSLDAALCNLRFEVVHQVAMTGKLLLEHSQLNKDAPVVGIEAPFDCIRHDVDKLNHVAGWMQKKVRSQHDVVASPLHAWAVGKLEGPPVPHPLNLAFSQVDLKEPPLHR
jgi:hypothetical protein